jgi:putative glutamine amidotransferase
MSAEQCPSASCPDQRERDESDVAAAHRRAPLIGVSQRLEMRLNGHDLSVFAQDELVRGLQAAGADVIVLTHTDPAGVKRYVDICDGILLPGGFDIDPSYFGEEILSHPEWVFKDADAFDVALARRAVETGTPLLGICRGAQVINVALGGDLWQDIIIQLHGGSLGDEELHHVSDLESFESVRHDVRVKGDSLLARALCAGGETDSEGFLVNPLPVNSSHHQAVRKLAPGFVASAFAPDGIVEAIEPTDPHMRVLGVQWHPERLWEHEPVHHRLFEWLVNEAIDTMDERHGVR